ncbi:hypothetical protein MA16_Dca027819 [Dendrobium catenatum]|uniref:Uncharacterized protein n=1 Tax=Dendrobium catenatum TaxID=906689 RepID=A0A2I0V791_9ASPA|nr:hypothetical protein MA16_Dca027819 [Dendrobium catenatum]
MAGGDRTRSSRGGGDGLIGGDERRRSGVGSGGSKKSGERSGAGSGGSPSKATMTRSKSKARDVGKSGSDGSMEGRLEVKLRGMDPKVEMLITKGGGQMNVNARKKEISPVDLKMELMPASEVNMMINPTFGGTEAGKEVEEILATMNDSDEMEETFDVDAAMPGQARSTVNVPDRMGVEQDGKNVVMNMGVPNIKIGGNGPETGSCDDGILRNTGMRSVNRFQLGPIEEFPRKRKKEMLGDHDREDISGGDTSPFVF